MVLSPSSSSVGWLLIAVGFVRELCAIRSSGEVGAGEA